MLTYLSPKRKKLLNTINNNKKDIIVINRRKQLIWEVKMMLKEQNYRTLSGR